MIPYNQSYFEKMGVKVTNHPIYKGYDASVQPFVEEAFKLSSAAKPNSLHQLQKWVEIYPHVAQFKNYLAMFLLRLNRMPQADAVILDSYAKHPHYLFAKIAYAELCLRNNHLEKAAELLDLSNEGTHLFAADEVLHESEWMSFLFASCRVAAMRGQEKLASKFLERAWHYNPAHKTVGPMTEIVLKLQKKGYNRQEQLEIQEERVNSFIPNYQPAPTTERPILHHPEVAQLYECTESDMSEALLTQLMSLPRPTLIADLCALLENMITRKEVIFQELDAFEKAEEGSDTDYFAIMDLPFHVINLLAGLNAEENLENVLNFFRQDTETLDMWIFDMVTSFEIPLYILGRNRLKDLQDFVLQRGNSYMARTAVSHAVVQVALHEPERRAEVVAWFKTVIEEHLAHPDDDDLIDTEFLSFLIANIQDFNGVELEREIELLFETGWINPNIQGDWKKVKADLPVKPLFQKLKSIPKTVFELYDFGKPATEKKDKTKENDFHTYLYEARLDRLVNVGRELFKSQPKNFVPTKPIQKSGATTSLKNNIPKVGRNELCPCGSNKKYKKCHGA